jgi:branched-chain amino acid transport system substrate-binding protein
VGKSLFRRALGASALALTLAGCAASDGPVKIGIAGPFTDPVGRPMLLAAQMAVAEINAAGGINGRPVELVAHDDFGEPDSAVSVAGRLYGEGVSAVVGHLWSGTTLAAAPIYNGGTDPVVAVSPSSSSPDVSDAGDYIFRVCPSDNAHGRALAGWVRNSLKLDRGTVFYLNDSYGRGVRQTFVSEFERMGGSVLAVNPYRGSEPDLSPYVDRLARDGRSQFMVMAGNRGEAEALLQQSAARSVKLPLLGGDGLEGLETSPLAEGSYQTAAYLPSVETEANRRFVQAWHARYPDAGMPNQPAAATYDAVNLLADVMKDAGTGRAEVRDALAARDARRPFDGVTGRIAFDSLGDVPSRQVYIAVVRDRALRLAGQQ